MTKRALGIFISLTLDLKTIRLGTNSVSASRLTENLNGWMAGAHMLEHRSLKAL
jgi:hypothetical protein